MKKVLFILSTVVLLAMNSCQSNSKSGANIQPVGEAKEMPAESETSTIAVPAEKLAMLKDPICDMDIKADALADTASYQGKLYGFCSKSCKASFVENPEKHLSHK
ncbi:MAG: YHS domain-containing protein [Chitinophagales bacterium]|nr:YHS domain-containing protein [Chitinophagales bacterium]